jgi:hypothetical protein
MIIPSDILKEMVDEVVSIERSNAVIITFHLRNYDDPEWVIEDLYLTSLIKNQSPLVNVMDEITVSADATPKQFQEMIERQNNLYADVIIEYANRQTNEVILEEKPIILRYRVFIHDVSNLLKQYGVYSFAKNEDLTDREIEVNHSVRIPITMQLMTEIDYVINKSSFTGTMQDVNVEDSIKYISSIMKVPYIKMTPPDNAITYQHLIIPPENSDFKVVFDYVNKKYGTYANGFRTYLTNGILYVYPPFDMKCQDTPKLNIFRVSENTYMGSTNYHKVEDNLDVSIVSNTELVAKNLSTLGSENEGNVKMFVRADGVIDGQVSKNKKLKLENISAVMSSVNDNSISKNSAITKYIKQPTLNVFDHGSTFSETDTELLTMGWTNARLNMIYPSMPVTFIFDEKDQVKQKTGRIESIIYNFTKGNRHLFLCQVALIIRVDPKQEDYKVS